jgi:hypothetical protein
MIFIAAGGAEAGVLAAKMETVPLQPARPAQYRLGVDIVCGLDQIQRARLLQFVASVAKKAPLHSRVPNRCTNVDVRDFKWLPGRRGAPRMPWRTRHYHPDVREHSHRTTAY